MSVMSIETLIQNVAEICKENKVEHLTLIGSFATNTATATSDIDFVAYGCSDYLKLQRDLECIETLRKIDILDYSAISNKYLLEDIEKYGRKIY